jgi:hypothetical protein
VVAGSEVGLGAKGEGVDEKRLFRCLCRSWICLLRYQLACEESYRDDLKLASAKELSSRSEVDR